MPIRLNGRNYAPRANSIEVYMMAKGLDTCLIDSYLDSKDPSYVIWKVEDARIRLRTWNSMEPQISRSLTYLIMAKQVWDPSKEMFFDIGNLHLRFSSDLFLSLGDMSLKDYYGWFRVVCKEIRPSESISFDIAAMERQRESM